MRMRNFASLLGVVAFVAILYSPATIGGSIPTGLGSTSATDTLQSGTSQFLAMLRSSGYHVILANNTLSAISGVNGQKAAYFLIGADNPLTPAETQAIDSSYNNGSLSLLIAEGNRTNEKMINQLFNANVTGNAIIDPASSFADKRVFTVALASTIGQNAIGVIDIASPIIFPERSSTLTSVAATSKISYDTANSTLGPRTVVAAGTNRAGSRAILITDSAPFTNLLMNYTASGVNEQNFVQSMVNWVTQSNKNTIIILDNSHYSTPGPSIHFGVPISPIIVYVLESYLSTSNQYYGSLPSQTQGFLQSHNIPITLPLAVLLVAGLILFTIYASLKKWFATEKKQNDILPIPSIEQTIVAESRARTDFLQTARSKSFYVATLTQLYEVLDTIVTRELGAPIASVSQAKLLQVLGEEGASDAARLFARLTRIHDYAKGKNRFLFPPVIRWKTLVSSITRDSEKFLNHLNITIMGAQEKHQIEYVARGH